MAWWNLPKQIKIVPMKEKIKQLFKEYLNDETMPVAELEDKVLALFDVVGQSDQLKAVEKLKDFAYEVCPLHREDDLEQIVGIL